MPGEVLRAVRASVERQPDDVDVWWEFRDAARWRPPEPWGLPPQSLDLAEDWRRLRVAYDRAETVDQLEACAVRRAQLVERGPERGSSALMVPCVGPMLIGEIDASHVSALLEALQASAREMGRRLAETMQGVQRAVNSAHLAKVTGLDAQPSDPMARALQARRNRNTGPALPRMDGRRRR